MRPTRLGRRGAALLLMIGCAAAFVATADHADAACHAFDVSVEPAAVKEGGKVTVTVSRDANVNPSSIHVSTVNESAQSPADYAKLDETVNFSSETSKELTIQTVGDSGDEPNETFRVHLSDPAGCAVNTNYVIGPDAKVTIQDDDPAAGGGGGGGGGVEPSAAPEPQPDLASLAPDVTSTPEVTASATPVESAESTTSPLAAPEESDDDGAPVGLIVGALIAAAAAATGAGVLWARRRA